MFFSSVDADAEDGFSAKIYLVGDETVNYDEKTSPSYGSSVSTKDLFGYGRYEFRAKIESIICASDEEVISGLFTYSYGGDANGNGIIDNNEIDFEFACSDPTKLSLTVWTDYESGKRRKVSRVIDMVSGSYKQTEKGKEGEYGTSHDPVGTLDLSAIGVFEPQNKFYVYGFEWKVDSIKFYLRDGDSEVVLWNFPEPDWDSTFIPAPPSGIHMNVWHTTPRWFGIEGLPYDDVANRGDWPANDEFLFVDWIKFWKF